MVQVVCHVSLIFRFFFNYTDTTEIYTLSLHDALPIYASASSASVISLLPRNVAGKCRSSEIDRKSTRLNSSHRCISYAVFCLKKKDRHTQQRCWSRTVEMTVAKMGSER